MAALQDKAPARRFGRGASDDDKSMGTLAKELKNLVIAYAKQETVDPLKALLRYVAWGVVGSFLLAVSAVLLTLAVVRAAQAETGTHLQGHWSWVPYCGGLIFAVIVLALVATRIGKAPR